MGSNSFQYRSCFVFHGLHLHMIYNFAVFWNHLWYYFSPELFQYKSNIKLLFNLKWKVRAENNFNILYTIPFYLVWYISYYLLISFTDNSNSILFWNISNSYFLFVFLLIYVSNVRPNIRHTHRTAFIFNPCHENAINRN